MRAFVWRGGLAGSTVYCRGDLDWSRIGMRILRGARRCFHGAGRVVLGSLVVGGLRALGRVRCSARERRALV